MAGVAGVASVLRAINVAFTAIGIAWAAVSIGEVLRARKLLRSGYWYAGRQLLFGSNDLMVVHERGSSTRYRQEAELVQTNHNLCQFKQAFKSNAEAVQSGVRWEPAGMFWQTQSSLAPVVEKLEALDRGVTAGKLLDLVIELQRIPTEKAQKYEAALSGLRGCIAFALKEQIQADIKQAAALLTQVEGHALYRFQSPKRNIKSIISKARGKVDFAKEQMSHLEEILIEMEDFPNILPENSLKQLKGWSAAIQRGSARYAADALDLIQSIPREQLMGRIGGLKPFRVGVDRVYWVDSNRWKTTPYDKRRLMEWANAVLRLIIESATSDVKLQAAKQATIKLAEVVNRATERGSLCASACSTFQALELCKDCQDAARNNSQRRRILSCACIHKVGAPKSSFSQRASGGWTSQQVQTIRKHQRELIEALNQGEALELDVQRAKAALKKLDELAGTAAEQAAAWPKNNH